jgi:hypothetical protein
MKRLVCFRGWRHIVAASVAASLVGIVSLGSGGSARAQSRPSKSVVADCEQSCFDHYVANQESCYHVNCTYIIIRISCNDTALNNCLQAALNTYYACRDGCDRATT